MVAQRYTLYYMTDLKEYLEKTVAIITSDGRFIMGTLKGFDQTINVILTGAVERIFSADEGVEQVQLGLYLLRGDSMCVFINSRTVIGLVDANADSSLNWSDLKAPQIPPIVF